MVITWQQNNFLLFVFVYSLNDLKELLWLLKKVSVDQCYAWKNVIVLEHRRWRWSTWGRVHGASVTTGGDKVGAICNLYFRTSPVLPQEDRVCLQAEGINRHDKLFTNGYQSLGWGCRTAPEKLPRWSQLIHLLKSLHPSWWSRLSPRAWTAPVLRLGVG